MSEADINGPFPAAATEAEVPPAGRRPLKMIDESAATIGSSGSLCMFMVRKDSGHLNEVRAAGGDSRSVVRVDRNRARRCPEEPGLARCRTRIGWRLPACCCHRGTRPFDERLRLCSDIGGPSMLVVDGDAGSEAR